MPLNKETKPNQTKWIDQTLTTSLVVIFRSLLIEELHQTVNKEQNITTKPVVSVWFI